MYTKSSACFIVNRFCTLLWTNEYEFQFDLHDDAKYACAKIRQAMGANVWTLAPIKSHHSCGNKLKFFIGGVLEKNFQFSTKSTKSFKAWV
jgi:hypothetical protein